MGIHISSATERNCGVQGKFKQWNLSIRIPLCLYPILLLAIQRFSFLRGNKSGTVGTKILCPLSSEVSSTQGVF